MSRKPSTTHSMSRVARLMAGALMLVLIADAGAQTPQQEDAWANCTAHAISGTYETSYGTLECQAGGPGLDCCYGYTGDECTSAIMLEINPDRPVLAGKWTYYNGTSGVIELGLTDDCALSNGLWGDESLTSVWGVTARTSGPKPASMPGEAQTSAPSAPSAPEPAKTGAPTAPPSDGSNVIGPPELALAAGIWMGTLQCDRGPTYVTLSTDIHPLDGRSNSAAARIDFADLPDGQPVARSYTSLNVTSGRASIVLKTWTFRPMDIDSLTGKYARANLAVSADGQTMTSESFGSCRQLSLDKMPAYFASGGIQSAEDLPPVLEGVVGCYGGQPSYFMRLHLTPTGHTSFEGQAFARPADAAQRDSIAAWEVFGDFDPGTTELTVVGDRWIRQSRQFQQPLDFSGVIRQSGQRLVGEGQSAGSTCGILDLHVPGADQSQLIARSLTPIPPEQWDTPSACLTLINWARQSLIENQGQSVYSYSTAGQAQKIGIGLFADERFVPFFAGPFVELTAAQRQGVIDVAEQCRHQQYSASGIYESGALQFIKGFFPDNASGEWLKIKRFQLLRRRLADEMAALEVQAVGEPDIGPLEARLAEIPERFSELWEADLAQARSLIGSKIDTAKGAMIDRLESEIAALPLAWDAFPTGRRIRSEIPALGEDRSDDQAILTRQLDTKLSDAADTVLTAIATDYSERKPSLNALQDLRRQLENRWPELDPFVNTGSSGFKAISQVLVVFANASFPSFENKTRKMIDEDGHFDLRTRQYGAAMNYYLRLVPSSRLFSETFSRYAAHIEALRPVPTRRDLVADDGSPTSLGLRYSVAAWFEDGWGQLSSIFPWGKAFVTNSIHVSDVNKKGCTQAGEGGHWCTFSMRFSGSMRFGGLMSSMPDRARFTLSDLTWNLVETPPQPPPSYDPYGGVSRQNQAYEDQFFNLTMEGIMMD